MSRPRTYLNDPFGLEAAVPRLNLAAREVLRAPRLQGRRRRIDRRLASISPHDGMRGVRELVRLVRECGFKTSALRVSALYNMVPASDRRYYPLYAKCVDIIEPNAASTSTTTATSAVP